MAAVLVS